MKLLILPEDLRSELKAPLGRLCRGDGLECVEAMADDLSGSSKIAAVGDMTAFYLLEGSVIPDLLIVDGKTKRLPVPDYVVKSLEKRGHYRTVRVENPPATLSEELIDLICRSLAGREHVRIVVDGEEDLATLPTILCAPEGSAVVYGQPNEGMVVVKVTPEKKDHIKSLMDRMEVRYKDGNTDH